MKETKFSKDFFLKPSSKVTKEDIREIDMGFVKVLRIAYMLYKIDEAVGSIKDWSLASKTNLGMHLSPYRALEQMKW